MVVAASTVVSVGLVVVGGAELFTGNNLVVMARVQGRITTGELLRNWGVSLGGNLAGAVVGSLVAGFYPRPGE